MVPEERRDDRISCGEDRVEKEQDEELPRDNVIIKHTLGRNEARASQRPGRFQRASAGGLEGSAVLFFQAVHAGLLAGR